MQYLLSQIVEINMFRELSKLHTLVMNVHFLLLCFFRNQLSSEYPFLLLLHQAWYPASESCPSSVCSGRKWCRVMQNVFWQWPNFTFDLILKEKMEFSCRNIQNYSVQIFHRTVCDWKTVWKEAVQRLGQKARKKKLIKTGNDSGLKNKEWGMKMELRRARK